MTIDFFINKAQYEALPDAYKAALDAACKAANINMQALYDVKNTTAIRSLVGKGVKLRPLPRDVMDAAYKTTFELYAEYSAKHPAWAKIYPGWKKFATSPSNGSASPNTAMIATCMRRRLRGNKSDPGQGSVEGSKP